MKRLKRPLSIILAFVLMLSSAGSLASCTKKSAAEDAVTYSVYYSNADASNIIAREYTGIDESLYALEKVEELFEQMFDYADEANGYYSAKPSNVEKLSTKISDTGILTVDFNSEYSSLTPVQEILLRAAVVLTVIQVDGISGVEFTIEGSPATDNEGGEIGTMTADNFAGILITEEGMLEESRTLTIFFADKEGSEASCLVPTGVVFYSASNSTISMEEYILQCLIDGPEEDSGVYRTVESSVVVLSVSTTDKICYVNFSSSFYDQSSVSDEILIYSIVNSLCSLSYVDSVQFLIEGELEAAFHEVTDLSQPLSRRRDLEQN